MIELRWVREDDGYRRLEMRAVGRAEWHEVPELSAFDAAEQDLVERDERRVRSGPSKKDQR